MRKFLLLLIVALAFSVAASATPMQCIDVGNSLAALVATNSAAEGSKGCTVQDKLFTNWNYFTGAAGTPATNVGFNIIIGIGVPTPGIDVHGFSFYTVDTAQARTTWTESFILDYTISVTQLNGPSTMSIVGATDQILMGVFPNAANAVSTKGNPGIFATYTLNQGNMTGQSVFPAVSSLNSHTIVNLGTGTYIDSLEESYTQTTISAIPEPMTFVLIGTGLVGLGLLRRRARKS